MASGDIKKGVSCGWNTSNYVSWCVDTVPASPNASPPPGHSNETESCREEKQICQFSHEDDDQCTGNEAPGSDTNQPDLSMLSPCAEQYHLPRSSPVISRRRTSLSWHGDASLPVLPPTTVTTTGVSDTLLTFDQYRRSHVEPPTPESQTSSQSVEPTTPELQTSSQSVEPPTLESQTSSHCVEPPTLDSQTSSHCVEPPTLESQMSSHSVEADSAPCYCPTGSQTDRPRSVSLFSNLNRLLTVGLHLPFKGQPWPGLDREECPRHTSLDVQLEAVKNERSRNIQHCSVDSFKTGCDLDKENAHFIVVDMVLEALEGVKWAVSLSQMSVGAMRNHREALGESGAKLRNYPSKTHSLVSTDSGYEGCREDSRPTTTNTTKTSKRSLGSPIMPCSAEGLAQQLVCDFRKQWFPKQELKRGRQSIRTSLQELPGGVSMVTDARLSLSEEIIQRTRMRGNLNWAPPRFQILFSIHPRQRRSEVVASQHFLCAGCGTDIEPKYIKKLRYCEYLGKYFCDCCHSGAVSVIPGRILTQWDFGRYLVSDFSKKLLDSVWHQPLFDLTCVGKTLYSRVRELDKFRDLQEQLLGIKRLLTACRLSESVLKEFEQLPDHLTEEPHRFSMDDLLRVKRGLLMPLARAVLQVSITHVESCQVCLARGFICEFCKQKDVLFPFQSETCQRCKECKACFHKDCFRHEKCPKCIRIQSRKNLMGPFCL